MTDKELAKAKALLWGAIHAAQEAAAILEKLEDVGAEKSREHLLIPVVCRCSRPGFHQVRFRDMYTTLYGRKVCVRTFLDGVVHLNEHAGPVRFHTIRPVEKALAMKIALACNQYKVVRVDRPVYDGIKEDGQKIEVVIFPAQVSRRGKKRTIELVEYDPGNIKHKEELGEQLTVVPVKEGAVTGI